jgi:hypothetical protein
MHFLEEMKTDPFVPKAIHLNEFKFTTKQK